MKRKKERKNKMRLRTFLKDISTKITRIKLQTFLNIKKLQLKAKKSDKERSIGNIIYIIIKYES